MFDSVTSVALQSALNGLSARQGAIAENVANINTPGYTAKRVQFEEALAASVADGDARRTAFTVDRSVEPTRLDGSNVNLDTETVSNVDTVLRYQFATQAVGGEAAALRAAMRTA
ncbi:flagellar basal body protein [Cellulosimicrobium cellulans]|jgi:flagellar basal-body rod protein FlgB|uniref:flagellar basal body rod protein FlgB n=1 Tax=Cellulosimicrobium TaxID=157920 RepID=UPI00088B71B6|nr:flagellar basal body protein [Sphaerisporangium cinnabarinum]MCR1984293.1 flagellar basal body protein [Cellulosimicrobium cellulans]PTU56388.1 flagellar biosynthesis protein FlgB [Sphaerisporangium cinnabarinum]SDF79259.1 flagellar basal-body rod protein FlgB [Cellulosimicrobium cellulans]